MKNTRTLSRPARKPSFRPRLELVEERVQPGSLLTNPVGPSLETSLPQPDLGAALADPAALEHSFRPTEEGLLSLTLSNSQSPLVAPAETPRAVTIVRPESAAPPWNAPASSARPLPVADSQPAARLLLLGAAATAAPAA